MPGGDSQPDPKPHWQGHRERLRGKLLKRGAGALEDYEVMEVILMAFIPLELSATAIILAHNHPSGDTTPSRADIDMTREIINVLDPLEITVHDHLIAGTGGVTSFRTAGLI